MRPEFDRLVNLTKSAFEYYQKTFPSLEKQKLPPKFEEYASQVALTLSDPMEESIYKRAYRIAREEYRESKGLEGVPWPSLIPPLSGEIVREKVRRYNEVVEETEFLNAQVESLRGEEERLSTELSRLGRPEGIWQGVAALIFFSLSGILFPIWQMPVEAARFSDLMKWAVIGGFTLGLGVLMAYLIWAVWKLTK